MSDLHETYATLLRRGMPEHKRFGCDDSGTFSLRAKVKCSDCAKTDGVSLLFDRDDAADVLTMHALRWVKTTTARVELDDDGKWACCIRTDWTMHDDALDAILAATAHLEPK